MTDRRRQITLGRLALNKTANRKQLRELAILDGRLSAFCAELRVLEAEELNRRETISREQRDSSA